MSAFGSGGITARVSSVPRQGLLNVTPTQLPAYQQSGGGFAAYSQPGRAQPIQPQSQGTAYRQSAPKPAGGGNGPSGAPQQSTMATAPVAASRPKQFLLWEWDKNFESQSRQIEAESRVPENAGDKYGSQWDRRQKQIASNAKLNDFLSKSMAELDTYAADPFSKRELAQARDKIQRMQNTAARSPGQFRENSWAVPLAKMDSMSRDEYINMSKDLESSVGQYDQRLRSLPSYEQTLGSQADKYAGNFVRPDGMSDNAYRYLVQQTLRPGDEAWEKPSTEVWKELSGAGKDIEMLSGRNAQYFASSPQQGALARQRDEAEVMGRQKQDMASWGNKFLGIDQQWRNLLRRRPGAPDLRSDEDAYGAGVREALANSLRDEEAARAGRQSAWASAQARYGF